MIKIEYIAVLEAVPNIDDLVEAELRTGLDMPKEALQENIAIYLLETGRPCRRRFDLRVGHDFTKAVCPACNERWKSLWLAEVKLPKRYRNGFTLLDESGFPYVQYDQVGLHVLTYHGEKTFESIFRTDSITSGNSTLGQLKMTAELVERYGLR